MDDLALRAHPVSVRPAHVTGADSMRRIWASAALRCPARSAKRGWVADVEAPCRRRQGRVAGAPAHPFRNLRRAALSSLGHGTDQHRPRLPRTALRAAALAGRRRSSRAATSHPAPGSGTVRRHACGTSGWPSTRQSPVPTASRGGRRRGHARTPGMFVVSAVADASSDGRRRLYRQAAAPATFGSPARSGSPGSRPSAWSRSLGLTHGCRRIHPARALCATPGGARPPTVTAAAGGHATRARHRER